MARAVGNRELRQKGQTRTGDKGDSIQATWNVTVEAKAATGPQWSPNGFIDQVSLECRNSRVPMELIGLLEGKDVMVGAIDVTTPAIETPEEVAGTIRSALRFVAPERLYPCTNCGMAPMQRPVAYAKMAALAEGAKLVRSELQGASGLIPPTKAGEPAMFG